LCCFGGGSKHWDVALPAVVGAVLAVVGVRRRAGNLRQRTSNVQHPTSRETTNSEKIRNAVSLPAVAQKQLGRGGPRQLQWLLPFLWLGYALFVFVVHRPWWAYYYVHVAVPLCWCGAIGVAGLFREVRNLPGTVSRVVSSATTAGFGIFVLCAAGWAGGRVYLEIAEVRRAPKIYSDLAIAEMKRFKSFAEFVYADEPVYSFHTGIPMVPNLAVIMLKRLWSGDMTNEKITAELAAAKPGLILLKNDTRVVPFKDLLETEYRLVYYDSAHRLYAHKTISRKRLK
jgi:hypothetical protein